MPNHYHLLVRLLSDNFSGAMKAFGISYSKAVNKRLTRVGPLFQGPFQAIHVDKEEYLLQLSRYIHLNPVQAQLCPSPEAWEFSSYRDFIGQRNGSLAMKDVVVDQFSSPQAYAEFVLAGIGKSDRKIKHLVIDD